MPCSAEKLPPKSWTTVSKTSRRNRVGYALIHGGFPRKPKLRRILQDAGLDCGRAGPA
jgi:hypothetical protein